MKNTKFMRGRVQRYTWGFEYRIFFFKEKKKEFYQKVKAKICYICVVNAQVF